MVPWYAGPHGRHDAARGPVHEPERGREFALLPRLEAVRRWRDGWPLRKVLLAGAVGVPFVNAVFTGDVLPSLVFPAGRVAASAFVIVGRVRAFNGKRIAQHGVMLIPGAGIRVAHVRLPVWRIRHIRVRHVGLAIAERERRGLRVHRERAKKGGKEG